MKALGKVAMRKEEFRPLGELVREHAQARPTQPALVQGTSVLSYGELDALMDRVAAALQRDGVQPGEAIALCRHVDAAAGGAVPRRAARRRGGGAARAVGHRAATSRRCSPMRRPRLLFVDAGAAALVPAACARALHRARCRRTGPRRSTHGSRRRARRRGRWRSRPTRRSTSSIRPARPARRRASCSRTACAGRTSCAARPYDYGPDARHAARHAAVLEHDAGRVLPDDRATAARWC